MIQYEIKITGRVQGVGYRYFAQLKATETGVKGWVKNSRDGGVLIVAQGDKTDVDTFVDYLKIGPPLARVNSVLKYEITVQNEFSGFDIKY